MECLPDGRQEMNISCLAEFYPAPFYLKPTPARVKVLGQIPAR